MINEYESFAHGLDAPAKDGFQIVPNDAVDLPKATRAIYVGVSGTIRMTLVSGAEVTLVGVSMGAVLPIRAVRVYATHTTAGELVGLL